MTRIRTIACIAALTMLGTIAGAPVSASADGGAAPTPMRPPGAKRVGALSLSLAPSAEHGGIRVTIGVHAAEDLRDVRVVLPDGVRWSAPQMRLGGMAAGTTRSVTAWARVPTSAPSQLTVRATGRSATGPAGAAAPMFLSASPGGIRAGVDGLAALAIEEIRARRARGELTEVEAARAIARAVVSVLPGLTVPKASGMADITLNGTVRWEDSGGALHPARQVEVLIVDKVGPAETVVATLATDALGAYTWTGNNLRATGDPRQFAVRARAKNPAGFVAASGVNQPYAIERNLGSVGASTTANLTADDPQNDDSHGAFSVVDSYLTARAYVQTAAGTAPAPIRTNFPVGGSVSFYCPPGAAGCQSNTLSILRFDRFDWDVLHHEYGHYVSHTYTIAPSPGGAHSLDENLADHVRPDGTKYGKSVGIRLAWGEGWPTYFGTSLQQVMGASALGVPKVGDTKYTDTEDYTPALEYDLESQGGMNSMGEDNELSDQRILWDIFDVTDDAGDQVSRGHAWVWNALVSAKAKHISDAWNAFVKGKTQVDIEVVRLGCVFTEHRVAPKPTAPADKINAPENPPEFTWDSHGGGPNFRNNKFFVEFYDATFQSKIFTSPQIDRAVTDSTGSWTPTADQWKTITGTGTPVVNWVVKASQTSAPQTGEYVSCNRRFIAPKTDLAFVIDVTGSMADDIAAVKAAATDLVNAIDFAAKDWRVGVVSFRDFPTSPYGDPSDWTYQEVLPFSNNKAAIVGAINSLSVGGGADWPESVYSALMNTFQAGALGGWREGVRKSVILMGDAPGHDPEPFTGYTLGDVTLAALLADPIQIYTLAISGCCPSPDATFSRLAADSGGTYFKATSASQVVGKLNEAIIASTAAPVADAGPLYYTGRAGVPVQFDAGVSYDVDGTIVSYAWDWHSDGVWDETSSGPLAYHTFASAGQYQIRLRVTDDDGNSSFDFADVTIAIPDHTPPQTRISDRPGLHPAPVAIAYQDSDPTGENGGEPTGVAQVALWYRYAPVAPEELGEDPATLTGLGFTEWRFYAVADPPTPFAFEPPEGSGVYELHTIGIDAAGNVEQAPDAPDLRLACAAGIGCAAAGLPVASVAMSARRIGGPS